MKLHSIIASDIDFKKATPSELYLLKKCVTLYYEKGKAFNEIAKDLKVHKYQIHRVFTKYKLPTRTLREQIYFNKWIKVKDIVIKKLP